MDETLLAVTALVACVFILTVGLVRANHRLATVSSELMQFNRACLKHALAESVNQREMQRIQFEADHQEFLLRESRAVEAKRNNIPPPPPARDGDPEILVNLDTGNSVN